MTTTIGIDIGAGAVKTVLFEVTPEEVTWLDRQVERVRQRDPYRLAETAVDRMLRDHGMERSDVQYVATTGDAESLAWSTGHFYSMTTHARGATHLAPGTAAVLDVGALHGRAIHVDPRGKVLTYQMTSQCASGSGQFLENIARYLGIAQDEIGPISLQGKNPEKVSSICAVLAETDVINMVSRGISAPDILRGIHLSMAGRLAQLIRRLRIGSGSVLVTGGLGLDSGLIGSLRDTFADSKIPLEVASSDDAIYAGAIGAALWGAFRHEKLAQRSPELIGAAS